MAKQRPKAGDTVYLDDGQIVELVAPTGGEYVVRAVREHEDGEPHYGRPFTVHEVFAEPPVLKFDERIIERRAVLDGLSQNITKLREERVAFERDERDRRARIQRHGQLEQLDNLLAGKITHICRKEWSAVTVAGLFDATQPENRYSNEVRGISLAGRVGGEGDISWAIDGRSGEVTFHTSREDAVERARAILDGIWVKYLKDPRVNWSDLGFYESAKRLGIAVPAEVEAAQRASEVATARTLMDRAEKEFAAAKLRYGPIVERAPSAPIQTEESK